MKRVLLLACLLSVAGVLPAQTTRPAITGIAFMRVYSTDAAAAQKFYGSTLGYHRIETGDMWVYPVNSSQWIEVLPHTQPPKPKCRMAAVGFTTRDAAALERYLNAHGVATVAPMHDGEFGVRDPEGNLVIFVQGGGHIGVGKLVATAAPSATATSHRVIHVGFIVRDRGKEDTFWRSLLGFRPYWYGGKDESQVDWVSQQVPNGTDWIEYMLNAAADPSLRETGVMDHFSLGVTRMQDVLAGLQANHCEGKSCTSIQAGRDGKVQLNLYDNDQTRVEYMEFKAAMKPCCSPFTGPPPGPEESK
jgi:catechol 2,3-dioxygenase-like lactoylglutathione lyase family enzyme